MEKTKPNTTKPRIHQSKEMNTTRQNKHKRTKARFSRLLRHLVWKRSGSILEGKLKISKEISKEKVKKKRISGEAYDINKQYI